MELSKNQIPASTCSSCNSHTDAATCVDGKSLPSPGDVSICLYCGHIAVFSDDMILRPLTSEEMHEVAGNKAILQAQSIRAEYERKHRKTQ